MIHVSGTVYDIQQHVVSTRLARRTQSLWSAPSACDCESQAARAVTAHWDWGSLKVVSTSRTVKWACLMQHLQIQTSEFPSPSKLICLQSSHLGKWQLWLWGYSCQNSWGYSWLLSSHTSISNLSAVQVFFTFKINTYSAFLPPHPSPVQWNAFWLVSLAPPSCSPVYFQHSHWYDLFVFIYLFYVWSLWLFVAARRLSPVAVHRLLVAAAPLVAERGSRRMGFSDCSSWALGPWLHSCSAQASLLPGTWDPPGPGIEPMSPVLAGKFFVFFFFFLI